MLTPQPAYPKPFVAPAFNALGILSSPSPSILPSGCHPPSHLAAKLWNIFKEHVEACAGLKLLHIPTDEVKVFSVIAKPSTASFEDLALCFAIYFASTVSLNPKEAELLLGKTKDASLFQFKIGLEQAFAHGDFLDRPTISGLHALAIYVVGSMMMRRHHLNNANVMSGCLTAPKSWERYMDPQRSGHSHSPVFGSSS